MNNTNTTVFQSKADHREQLICFCDLDIDELTFIYELEDIPAYQKLNF